MEITATFCFIALFSLIFITNPTMSQPTYMYTFCSTFRGNFTSNSLYESNRDSLLSNLNVRSSIASYSNATFGLNPNTVRGMFLCRGDISSTTCFNCVNSASRQIKNNCTNNEEAIIYYEECMVRYSDWSFFSVNEDRPYIIRYDLDDAPTVGFPLTLSEKMDELIGKVSFSSSTPYFVQDQDRVKEIDGSYDLDSIVQCSPDLDSRNCTLCLRLAFQELNDCCNRSQWAQIFTPKCLLRFETTVLESPSPPPPPPFLRPRSPPPPPFSFFDPFDTPPTFFRPPTTGGSNMKGKGIGGIVVAVVASVLAILAF